MWQKKTRHTARESNGKITLGTQMYSSEKEYLLASLLNHEDSLKLDTIQDIFAIKSSNKQFQQKAGKLQFLNQIKEKLKDLPANSMELQRISTFINSQMKQLGSKQSRSINTNYTVLEAFTCRPTSNCVDYLDMEGPPVNSSIFDPSPLMIYAESLARLLDKSEIIRKLERIKKMKCKHSIRHSSIVILHE